LNLCIELQEDGDLEGAIDAYRRAVEADPNSAEARVNLDEAIRISNNQRDSAEARVQDLAWVPTIEEEPRVSLLRSIVKVIARRPSGNYRYGTGWIFKREGSGAYVLTNCHVVSDSDLNLCTTDLAKTIEIEFFSNPPPGTERLRVQAEIEHITEPPPDVQDALNSVNAEFDSTSSESFEGESWDLAVLRVNDAPNDIEALRLANSPLPRGAEISVVGHPGTVSLTDDWWIINGQAPNGSDEAFELFPLINVNLGSGNSGSPVLNDENLVVGMVFRVSLSDFVQGSTERLGIAYTTSFIRERLNEWGLGL
jgi:hypothetical protein